MNKETPVCRLSVRAVVETTYHESDLVPAGLSRLREGTMAHRARQARGERDEAWRSEVPLSASYAAEGMILKVSGRADAVIAGDPPTIEEIKLGAKGEALQTAHRAQAALYGHMLCERDGVPRVRLRVLYAGLQGEALEVYEEEQSAEALSAEFDRLCSAALAWERKKLERLQRRDASLTALPFPYPAFRPGQRRFAAGVWRAVEERRRLFAQAPTGIGKTMAALWPALRAAAEGKAARVLYLTARNTGRQTAVEAARLLEEKGARLLACEIAAKDKVCPLEKRDCRPEACGRARGYYDRLPQALKELLAGGVFGKEEILDLAARHTLCPFELSLAAAQLADLVVCDYNYVYDPAVSVDALLRAPGGAVLLVDEAHQLPSRVRDAYSAAADMDELRALRRQHSSSEGRKNRLYAALTLAIRALSSAAEAEEFGRDGWDPPEQLDEAMEEIAAAAAEALAAGGGGAAGDAYALGTQWTAARARFDTRWTAVSYGSAKHAGAALRLLDASPEILAVSKAVRGCAYFSATLSPADAQRRILGAEEGDLTLELPSPFSPEQLRAEIAPIDVRYAAREQSAPRVAQAILAFLRDGGGNALVFFPSYAYLSLVAPMLEEAEDLHFVRERRGMPEEEKRAMLEALSPGGGDTALLCVLGGAFSEAVDLPGDRLSCVAVVSTGIPMPDAENAAQRRYYDAAGADGWFLTMVLPGITRVIQAAGRLIRTENDRGRLLLIDSRYAQSQTRRLLEGTLIGDALKQNGKDSK
ncbi:MAG: hypothetical protein IJ573_01420 [Clostridia bacterium]|nr:hypothetical protein [Clostridia bacterium]